MVDRIARQEVGHTLNRSQLIKYPTLRGRVDRYSSRLKVRGMLILAMEKACCEKTHSQKRARSSVRLARGPGVEGIRLRALRLCSPSFPAFLPYGMRAGVGNSEAIPHQAAGMRRDPPLSEPIPRRDAPAEMRAASPPELPPGVRVGSEGRVACPQRKEQVLMEELLGVADFTKQKAPACLRIRTKRASSSLRGYKSLQWHQLLEVPFT